MSCLYKLPFPDGTIHCDAYYSSECGGKKHWWAHFPVCNDKNCPIKHPELLQGAKLEEHEVNANETLG